MQISIKNLDKTAVLAALFNNAKAQGFGFTQHQEGDLPITTAQQLLEEETYFDYVQGRVMKVDLSGETLDTSLYDRDNGVGAAERALKKAGLI